ncbi:MAG: pyridoxamine 5'-phosphate oxidase [Proteobacteria bacterium]|nr:pyridoxamine 5'-phosphate oxidase [Pseudomonadota bacterium]
MTDKVDGFAKLRREYGVLSLDTEKLELSPFKLFKLWFEDILKTELIDPTAMVLSTVDEKGMPDSRVVLLKGIEDEAFIFYSNYNSAKGVQLKSNPKAALNFFWPNLSRQVRIRGEIHLLSPKKSDEYFASRPEESQISAIVSKQSEPIENRFFLEKEIAKLKEQHQLLKRPEYWGGYMLKPLEIEFWQGRDNRLHDRVFYYKDEERWKHCILAP